MKGVIVFFARMISFFKTLNCTKLHEIFSHQFCIKKAESDYPGSINQVSDVYSVVKYKMTIFIRTFVLENGWAKYIFE